MKRASSSLFSTFTMPRRTALRLFFSVAEASTTPVPYRPAPLFSSPRYLRFLTHGPLPDLCRRRQFRNAGTVPGSAEPSLSSRQREFWDLFEAFRSATTTEDMLASFAVLETYLGPHDEMLGLACLQVGKHLHCIGYEEHEKTLDFSRRALQILDRANDGSLAIVMTLHLLGSISFNLKKFNDSLDYLNRADRLLRKMEEECSRDDLDLLPMCLAVQDHLAITKTAMGRRGEALVNHRKCFEIKEEMLEPNSGELGVANRNLADAYVAVLNYKEALPLCLKALKIHRNQLGEESVEVAHDCRLLGVIYTGLEEHEKALEQNGLLQKVLKGCGMDSELLHAEIDAASIQIAMGKHDEAIATLRGVLQQTDDESETRAWVFVFMAEALCNQGKFADSKKCLQISCGVLEKKEQVSPIMISKAYAEMAMLYQTMDEFETVISLLTRTISILEKHPHEQLAGGSASGIIGSLLRLTGKVPQAIPYLEDAAERIKESFGPKHFGVGYIYRNLGAAYMELDRPQSAAQMFALSKDILDASLGPYHAESIEACHNLANAYGAMGSYVLAMDFQQKVIDAWENHGSSANDEIREAHRLLEQLKKKAR